MKKKQALTIVCVLSLAACVFAFGRRQDPSARASQQPTANIPEHVIYKHLFHHVMALKRKAEDVEKEGKDATQFKTHFTRKATLTPEQSSALEEVASELEQEEQMIAERAKPLIAAYKAQYPNGQVPHGQTPVPPPPELRKLSEERDASVLRARDRLRLRLGDAEFARFDNFVKTKIAPNVQMQ
ncbi:MAG: fructose,6-bisphosphatase [Pyrinomonadaceae bacterium]|jgi:hypothetical protein|nr:fructose,6-bisphosphatase [Pyrinomonadaceae bacterium]